MLVAILGTTISPYLFFWQASEEVEEEKAAGLNSLSQRQAAEALRPLAGRFAATLFTVGVVGVGFLAIPTLAGSAAYAFAETLGWRQGSG